MLKKGWLQAWFSRLLYRSGLLLAVALGGLVVFAPLRCLVPPLSTWDRVWQLFALDPLVRKTAVISALGLWITAVVFFRPACRRELQPERDGA